MSHRPNLLFLSPITPSTTGNGLAMRAGAFLEALAGDFEVHLLIVPVAETAPAAMPPSLAGVCRAVQRVPLSLGRTFHGRLCQHPLLYPVLGRLRPFPTEWKVITRATLRAAAHAFEAVCFDHIHVCRLYLHPFAEGYARLEHNRAAPLHLDLDELESATREDLATLRQAPRKARRLRRDAALYRRLERSVLPVCDRVYVCSAADADVLRNELGVERVAVLPNTVRLPAAAAPDRESPDPFTFLFVGNLDYAPNRDALLWFMDQVLPALRRLARGRFRVRIIGSGRPRVLGRLADTPEIALDGFVASVDAAYAGCDAVIAPIRAGGGTRIKILEALAWGRPVVATSMGAAGLELEHGADVLLADDAAGFAAACADLMADPALRRSLGSRGRDKVREGYSQQLLRSRLRTLGIGQDRS